MLSQAAARALRLRPASVLPRARTASTSQWLRSRSTLSIPRTLQISSASQWSQSSFAARTSTTSTLQSMRSYANDGRPPRTTSKPKQHPSADFDVAATPDRNGPPQSTGAGPGISEAKDAGAGAQQDYTKDQEEFAGPQSASENTDPTTESPQQPQKPLPDLRQGIPSTFGAEFLKDDAAAKSNEDPSNVTEDPAKGPVTGGAGGREGGELPKSAYETSTDRRRNRVANYSYIAALLLGTGGAVYLGRNWETDEEERMNPEAPSGWGFMLMYNRAKARLNSQMGYYTEPTFPKLLPDIDPSFPVPDRTLVISLEDMLIHSEWSTKHGWRTAKRPGADYFLRYLSQHYELVIWTSLKSQDADMVIRKLDPFRIVMWPLFREATRYEKGEYVKDLSCLNRDLSKVLIIDTNPAHVKHQPENAIILPKWKGDPKDKNLVSLIPFLEYLAMTGADVPKAIQSFNGKDIPSEFARREARARELFNKDLAERRAKKPKHSAGGMLMGALGLKAQQGGMTLGDGQSLSEGFEQGKMLSDQFRERSQKQYEALEKEIRENGEKWLKEMAEEEKKFQEEQMKSMKSGAFGWLGGAGGPPQQQ
ncbi:hypothetical protein BDV96DRAFT_610577 [Lophiotrema nucula]|uniref:Mitochondrial import inner membrane translocase subunit TIM50 n=1 Tax=Lophiotrema nucula TaxID=690887 RepID=A0A6A5ZLF3_9PLEO|nr:hypothetical protein BDV96DRAFT_610577 [Lophiotrema nucula]